MNLELAVMLASDGGYAADILLNSTISNALLSE